jgi:exodeoxyribonuclease VII small subunit
MSKTEKPKPSFEQSLEQLEGIVHELEDGNVDLESSLAQYEHGVKLLRQCYQILEKAERKIEVLKAIDENGQPIVEPMDDEDLSLDEKGEQRSKRRSSGAKGKKKAKRKPKQSDTDTDTDVDVPGALF